jgi:hypothetical protein
MKFTPLLAVLVASTAGVAAQAQDFSDVSVGVGVTSFGYALQGEYQLQPNIGLRAMIMGGIKVSGESTEDDVAIDGTLELGGVAMLADYYPLSGAWRVSAGLFLSNTELNGTFVDAGTNYEGKVAFENEIAPIITTGFKYPFGSGWSFSGDVGVIVSSLEISSPDAAGEPDVQDSIDDANADLSDIPVFPYVGFAISYSY